MRGCQFPGLRLVAEDVLTTERCAMNGLKRLLVLGLLVAAGAIAWFFAYGGTWFGNKTNGSSPATAPLVETRSDDAPARPAPGLEPTGQDERQANSEGAPGLRAPAFDIVRVEDAGNLVIAGTAPPNWSVKVETQAGTIGQAEAGFDGAWVLMPEDPLPSGDHSLSLKAMAPDSSRTISGEERVAVSVAPDRGPAVVALSEDDQPTRVLQSGDAAMTDQGARDEPRPVAFSAVDYADKQQTGKLHLSGRAAPEARIALYLDNRFIGSAKADDSGSWQFTITDVLDAGSHALRADHVDMDRGDVLSRAEVTFNRKGVSVALAEGGETRSSTANGANPLRQSRQGDRSGEAAGVQQRDSSGDGADPTDHAGNEPAAKQAIVVRRGDTLWHIAEEHYGSGVRYTKIFRNNRDQIRSPHQIYPGQQFELPE